MVKIELTQREKQVILSKLTEKIRVLVFQMIS
jgi:hypothetical protein